eukprot:UC1_evm3s1904
MRHLHQVTICTIHVLLLLQRSEVGQAATAEVTDAYSAIAGGEDQQQQHRHYTIIPGANAVPTGHYTTSAKTAQACGEVCDTTRDCVQWSFNNHKKSDGHHHCYTSSSKVWHPEPNDHVVSGCYKDSVSGCPILPPAPPRPTRLPYWTAARPDDSKPLFGYTSFANVTDTVLYRPENANVDGFYNHAAMIAYHEGTITVSWKNAPLSEDTPGQRILYTQSRDGKNWTKPSLLFPNMSSLLTPAAQFAGPFAVLNGRLYASASPAVIADGDAQGAQFCLWPDGLDPRNCATPDRPGTQPSGLLMMRRVDALSSKPSAALPPRSFGTRQQQQQQNQDQDHLGVVEEDDQYNNQTHRHHYRHRRRHQLKADDSDRIIPHQAAAQTLGDIFWVSAHPPSVYAKPAAANGVRQLADMDDQTRADIAMLTQNGVGTGFVPPCAGESKVSPDSGNNSSGSGTLKCEACAGGCQHYAETSSRGLGLANERTHYRIPNSTADVILFRAHSGTLWSSVRVDGRTEGNWSRVVETNIPNDDSNLNAGSYANGVYLVHNVAPAKIRDPLTVSLSHDGYNFHACHVVQTCTNLAGGKTTCKARNPHNGNVGPSYPQGLSVVSPAPESMRGLWVVATNNKEDVVISHVPWAALDER